MFNYLEEFNRQVENLLSKDYPKLANISKEKFLKYILPLKDKLKDLDLKDINIEKGHLPFVIVVQNSLIPVNKTVPLINKDGKSGAVKLFPHKPTDFQTLEEVIIPNNPVYLLIDIDRGKGSINLAPIEAMKVIKQENRTPLTIEEGVAIVTHFPEFLTKNNCFSLLASRHTGDKRVPALWINAKKNVNLGWCWEGNPHTWLGSASASQRIGI